MTATELIKALREKPSRDNRALLDEAADRLEEAQTALVAIIEVVEREVDKIEKQKAEIERLELLANAFASTVAQSVEREESIRAEAVKEFADKVLDLIYEADGVNPVSEWQIRNLVKELTEGSDNDGGS